MLTPVERPPIISTARFHTFHRMGASQERAAFFNATLLVVTRHPAGPPGRPKTHPVLPRFALFFILITTSWTIYILQQRKNLTFKIQKLPPSDLLIDARELQVASASAQNFEVFLSCRTGTPAFFYPLNDQTPLIHVIEVAISERNPTSG